MQGPQRPPAARLADVPRAVGPDTGRPGRSRRSARRGTGDPTGEPRREKLLRYERQAAAQRGGTGRPAARDGAVGMGPAVKETTLEATEASAHLDLRQLLRVARRWWWLLLLAPLLAGGAAYAVGSQRQPLYAATATLRINLAQSTGALDFQAIQGSKGLAETYRQMVELPPVLEPVVGELGLPYGVDELQRQVSARAVPDTQLLEISVSDADPERAATLANAIAARFTDYIARQAVDVVLAASAALSDQIAETERQIEGTRERIRTLEQGANASDPVVGAELDSLRATLTQQERSHEQLVQTADRAELVAAAANAQIILAAPADVPGSPFAPRIALFTLIAALLGLVVGAGGIVLLEYLDNTVKASADFPALTGGPLLAAVGEVPSLRGQHGTEQLILLNQPKSSPAEAIRLLRANLQFAAATREITRLVVTSPGPGDGKSTVTANLAVAVAQAGFSTVVIDADLRRPSQHRIFGARNELGLTTLLARPGDGWRWATVDVGVPNLTLIPSGPLPPNPADLLSLGRLADLLAAISDEVDTVLIDTPPVLAVSDPLVVATKADGVVLVCRAGHTRLDALRRSATAVHHGTVRVVGVVLNQQTARDASEYYYYSGYYGSDTGAPSGPAEDGRDRQPGDQRPAAARS